MFKGELSYWSNIKNSNNFSTSVATATLQLVTLNENRTLHSITVTCTINRDNTMCISTLLIFKKAHSLLGKTFDNPIINLFKFLSQGTHSNCFAGPS